MNDVQQRAVGPSAPVGVVQRRAQLDAQVAHHPQRQPPEKNPQQLREQNTVHVLQNEEVLALVPAQVEHLDDIKMREPRNEQRLFAEQPDENRRPKTDQAYKFLSEAIGKARTNNGRVVRSLGDGFLMAFDSVDDALAHAATAQAEAARLNPSEVPLKIRCGIHYGDVIEADGDVFGVAVYLASRVTSHAHGGEILLTEAARETSERPDPSFNDFGPTLLPGFEDPVHLFEYARR